MAKISFKEKIDRKVVFTIIPARGDKGDKGDKGDRGQSAYTIAVANGFKGTESEWEQIMANAYNNAQSASNSASSAASSAAAAAASADRAEAIAEGSGAFDNYYDKAEIDSKISTINASINTKANASNVYTKSEIDSKVSTINTSIGTKANASNVYTKTETDDKITELSNKAVKYSYSGNTAVGVAVGQSSTGTTTDKKFEVASDYTSVFNGDVEIKQNLDISVEDITDQVTITGTGGRSVTGYTAYKQGNRIFMSITFGTGSSVAAGGVYFTGKISGCPLPVQQTTQLCFLSSSNVIIVACIYTTGTLTIRPYVSSVTSALTVNIYYFTGTIPT